MRHRKIPVPYFDIFFKLYVEISRFIEYNIFSGRQKSEVKTICHAWADQNLTIPNLKGLQ